MPFPESGIRVSRAGSAGALLVIRSQSSKEISGGFGAWVEYENRHLPKTSSETGKGSILIAHFFRWIKSALK